MANDNTEVYAQKVVEATKQITEEFIRLMDKRDVRTDDYYDEMQEFLIRWGRKSVH